MDNIPERKKEIRKELSSLRNGLDDTYRADCDDLIFDSVVESEVYLNSRVILAFYPIKSEPQILPIIERALDDGKKVAFPISNKTDYTLSFRYINRISDLKTGAYSIPEPPQSCKEYTGEGNALCIVPALAFDKHRMRIGYGKGFYDRFLSKFRGATMGICYSKLLVEELPCEETDVPIDIIITERGMLR